MAKLGDSYWQIELIKQMRNRMQRSENSNPHQCV
jgi:hypothetical protein